MTGPRKPEQIEREIETTRTQLAGTLDELAERVSPERLAGQARDRTAEFFQTPVGMAVIGERRRCWSPSGSPARSATAELAGIPQRGGRAG